jgi:hypothetical protein
MSTSLFRRTLLAATVISCVLASTPAQAHEGPLGDGGPFRVEIASGLPEQIDARFGNGEIELHVSAGTEIVVIGYEREPFAKIDAEGNMFGNLNSPTWWMTLDKGHGSAPRGLDLSQPNWEWVRAGGSLQYHDHRVHYMVSSIDESLHQGGQVFDFALPFIVDGAEVSVTGAMVFDPTLDPAGAERLIAGNWTPTVSADAPHGDTGPKSSSPIPYIAGIGVVVVLLAGVGYGISRRR